MKKETIYKYVTQPIATFLDFINIPKRIQLEKRKNAIRLSNKADYIEELSKILLEEDLQKHALKGEYPNPKLIPLLIAVYVDKAYKIFNEKKKNGCFDEFTSVINREVAQIGSYAVQKTIRKNNKKFIAISCHYDIIEWLEPDWTFCTDTMEFEICKKKDQKSNVKSINVQQNYGKYLGNIII